MADAATKIAVNNILVSFILVLLSIVSYFVSLWMTEFKNDFKEQIRIQTVTNDVVLSRIRELENNILIFKYDSRKNCEQH